TAEYSIRSSTKRPVSRSYSYLFRLPRGISTMTLTVSISVPLRLLWGGAMAPPAPGPVAAFYAGRQPVDGTAVLARAEAATPSAHCTAGLARRGGRAPFCCTLVPCGVLRQRLFHYPASGPAFRQGPFGRSPIRVGGGRTRAVPRLSSEQTEGKQCRTNPVTFL